MNQNTSKADFRSATGKLVYNLTNDFLFKALLQKNELVLKALICSLLHMRMEEIHSVVIINPIELGNSINAKNFFLDVKVILNDETVINLEMQVINEGNWPERSISYLSRSFDNLNKGTDYTIVKPAIHIGFLNFTPQNLPSEFYATYQLCNINNHTVYSDKFVLSVVDLTQIDLATEEDKKYQVDCWAKFFLATTWEELKMIAENNQYIAEACATLYQLTADDAIREQCEQRERFYNRQKGIHMLMEQHIDKILEQEAEISKQEEKISKQEAEINKQEAEISKQEEKISKQEAEISKQETEISKQEEKISKQEAEMNKQEEKLTALHAENASLSHKIAKLEAILKSHNIEME
jgi:predicted transposase/invertase (TIGR01784 family)